MTSQTRIEWTDTTWSPLVGCTAVSPGCKHCYAATMAWRLAHNPHPRIKAAYEGLVKKDSGGRLQWTGKVRCLPERLGEPLTWRKPRRVFVNSMSDLFHPAVPSRFRADVYSVMLQAEHHTFQVLTKRPNIMRVWASELISHKYRHLVWHGFTTRTHLIHDRHGTLRPEVNTEAVESPEKLGMSCISGWEALEHARNIWLGTSVESADHIDRIDHLRACPAAVRFLSLEPLLGPLPDLDLSGIDWVIVGDESGPRRRPAKLDWVREIRDQCVAVGVPFFFKQWHEGRRKLSTPELDGRRWVEWPDETGRLAA